VAQGLGQAQAKKVAPVKILAQAKIRKNGSTCFSKFFSKMTKKIIVRVLAGNCRKTRHNLLQMFWRILDKNLSHFPNIYSDEIDLEV
jgi:hypothetical protein